MIGDSYESDIIGAQNAGIDQIYYNPNPKPEDKDKTFTFEVNSLKEIMDII